MAAAKTVPAALGGYCVELFALNLYGLAGDGGGIAALGVGLYRGRAVSGQLIYLDRKSVV